MKVEHNPFIYWLSGRSGRWTRIGLGILLVLFAWFNMSDDAGIFALIGGLIIGAAGLLNFSLLAPLFHEPFFGYSLRHDDPMARF